MISVIISTYNRAKLLKKAVDSVLAQTYPDFELIVVDDCSTDDTKAVVGALDDPRIRYIKLNRNFGNHSRPKNKGILSSKGEYICFLDDDNNFRPDHLAVLLKEIEGFDVVYGDRWIVEGGVGKGLGVTADFDPAFLLKRNFIDTSDSLIRREALFYVGGWDERYKRFLDWNLYLRMAKAGMRFKHVSQILTDYAVHKGMLSLQVENKENPNLPAWNPYDCEIRLPYLGEIPEPRVAVYSITYDRLEYTKQSFDSLYKTAGYPLDHFVIDNGSKDGTVEWLADWQNPLGRTHVHFNGENKGISIASNRIVADIGQDYDIILKFDNDCMCLTDGWLDKMVEIWKSNHLLALSCYVQGLRDNPGGAPRLGYGLIKGELVGMTRHLGGICHFVSAKAYGDWKWPEDEFLHGLQDLEFSQYLIAQGYQMGYLENYFVSHGPLGTEAQKKDYPEYFERRIKEKQTRYE